MKKKETGFQLSSQRRYLDQVVSDAIVRLIYSRENGVPEMWVAKFLIVFHLKGGMKEDKKKY